MSCIPKIIHYCWFGGNNLSELALKSIDSWKKYCPDYKIVEWNEKNFDINCNKYIREAYETKKWAFVTDYVRLFVLSKYGGIYMDTDVEVVRNIDEFLHNQAFLGFETTDTISTAIIGAMKGNPWIKTLLPYYDNRHFISEDGSFDTTTNVDIITKMTKANYSLELNNTLQKTNGDVSIYPKDYFCPKDYFTGRINITQNTYTIHHFSASWHTQEERLQHEKLKRYMNTFGERWGHKIYILNAYFSIFKTKGIIYCFKKLFKKLFKKM